MKKLIIPFICLAILSGSIFVFQAAGSEGEVYGLGNNLALNKPYTAAKAFTADPAALPYQDVDGSELTDGKLAEGAYGTEWHGFDNRLLDGGDMFATVDLGQIYDNLYVFEMVFFANNDSGISPPVSVEYFVSDTGEDGSFVPVGKATKGKTDGILAYYTYVPSSLNSGRYVKAVIDYSSGGVFIFCCEFLVYDFDSDEELIGSAGEQSPAESSSPEESSGTPAGETELPDIVDKGLSPSSLSSYKLNNGNITGIPQGLKVSEFLKGLDSIRGISVYDKEGRELKNSDIIPTGAYARDSVNDKNYTFILYGDINGDGVVDEKDISEMTLQLLIGEELDDSFYAAADINGSGGLTTADMIMLMRQVREITDLYEGLGAEKGETEMNFKMTTANEYMLTYTAENGVVMTQTIDKKTWGTWNIGTLKAGGEMLAGGGTDWEYVYRASKTGSGSMTWSGGNHGNEKLIDITFYNDVTGEKIELSTGESVDISRLRVVENTKLHLGDENDTYADVTRTYTFAGQKITLDVSYDFTQDTYFQLSYTCMFPVQKTVGLYCVFLNDDGTTKLVETEKVGKSDYSGPMYKDNPASSCYIYGYQHPEYSFLVEVYSKQDSLDSFKNTDKTFYWDMNTGTNKLYFGKYDSSSYTKVPAGTHWETSCSWTFLIDG